MNRLLHLGPLPSQKRKPDSPSAGTFTMKSLLKAQAAILAALTATGCLEERDLPPHPRELIVVPDGGAATNTGTGGTATTGTMGGGGAGGTGGVGGIEVGGGGAGETTTTETAQCTAPADQVGIAPNKVGLCPFTAYAIEHNNGAPIDAGKIVVASETGTIDNISKDGGWMIAVGRSTEGDVCANFLNGTGVQPSCYIVTLPEGCADGGNELCLSQVIPNYCDNNGQFIGLGDVTMTLAPYDAVVCAISKVTPPSNQ